MLNRRSRRQRKQPSPLPLPETVDTSEAFAEDSLDEVKNEKQNAESFGDELFCQLSHLICDEDADKNLIQEAQQMLMRAKEKAFNVMTELRKIYRARGEHKEAEDVDADMDLCQSRNRKNYPRGWCKVKRFRKECSKSAF